MQLGRLKYGVFKYDIIFTEHEGKFFEFTSWKEFPLLIYKSRQTAMLNNI